jgi:transposase-like protein
MLGKTNGEMHYTGGLLESVVGKTRDKNPILNFLIKTMRSHGQPEATVADKHQSYRAALNEIRSGYRQKLGRSLHNRA